MTKLSIVNRIIKAAFFFIIIRQSKAINTQKGESIGFLKLCLYNQLCTNDLLFFYGKPMVCVTRDP